MRFKINESTLKIIAMVSMFIDHAAVAFPAVVPEGSAAYFVMRVIGRIAAPVFFWLLVQGYHHSSDLRKYLLRLLIFAFISEIPFNMLHGVFLYPKHQNVFFTLALGLAALWAADAVERKLLGSGRTGRSVQDARSGRTWQIWLLRLLIYAAAGLLAWAFKTDYQFWGIALIVAFSLIKRYNDWRRGGLISAVILALQGWIEAFAIIALPLLYLDDGERGRLGRARWFYLVYPAHLLLLGWLRMFVFVS